MNRILKKKILHPTCAIIEIEAPLIARNAEPGQFILLRVDAMGERIPLTIFDKTESSIFIIYQIVGATTVKLHALTVGDCLHDTVGPLGEPTPIPTVKNAVIVGGGIGCGVAFPLAKKCQEMGIDTTAIIGFRTKDLVILEEEFRTSCNQVIVTTDDGSYQTPGFVTTALSNLINRKKPDIVYAIGPLIMMKMVSELTQPYAIPTVVSLNSIMVDGTGMCGGCRVSVGGKMKFACVDGPDFDGHLVDFDETIARNKMYQTFEKKHYEDACHLLNKVNHE